MKELHARVWRSRCFTAVCGAATRTDELVVQKHLNLTRAAVRELRLYTVSHCETTVRLWQDGAPRGNDEDDRRHCGGH